MPLRFLFLNRINIYKKKLKKGNELTIKIKIITIKNQVWRVKGDDWRSGVLVIPHSYCANHDYFPFLHFFGHMTVLFEGDSTRVAEAQQYIPF